MHDFQQEGSLCAQHCLNSLVQGLKRIGPPSLGLLANDSLSPGPYFTAVDLGNIARDLDEEERQRMAEGDVESEEYQKFLRVRIREVNEGNHTKKNVHSPGTVS